MFKQLSQLGNNLKEELSKSLQEDSMNDNGSPLPEEYLEYPKEVQFKLKKFMKYESKYPLLLQAYKNEKVKNSQNEKVFKVLSEHTPIQSFVSSPEDSETFENQESPVVEELKQFFQNIQLKTDMLNEEIKRLTLDVKNCKMENEDLKTQLSSKDSQNGIPSESEESVEVESADLNTNEAESTSTVEEVDDSKKEESSTKDQLSTTEEEEASTKETLHTEKAVLEKEESPKKEKSSAAAIHQKVDSETPTSESALDVAPQPSEKTKSSTESTHKTITPATTPVSEAPSSPQEKKPRSAIQWQIKYNSLKSDYDTLKNKYDDLTTQNQTTSRNLKAKSEELDNVRDMLKEVGNQLVEVKDQTKESNLMSKKYQVMEKTLKDEMASKKNIMNTLSVQKDEFLKRLETFNFNLKQETQAKKDLERKIVDTEKVMNYKESQLNDASTKLSESELDLKQLRLKHERFIKNNENAIIERDQYKKQLEELNKTVEEKIKENGKLSERLEMLQEKFSNNKNIEQNSSDVVENMKRQCNELSIKLRESIKLKNSLEEDLNETMSNLQDKSRELTNLKRSIGEQDSHISIQVEEWKNKYIRSAEANKRLENELNLIILKQRDELETSKKYIADLKSKISILETSEQNLRDEIGTLNKSFSMNKELSQRSSSASEVLNATIENLKAELTKAIKLSREYEQSNLEMKKLNQELNMKYDRMAKNYKSLSLQLKNARSNDLEILKSSTRRHSSTTSLSSLNDDQTSINSSTGLSSSNDSKTPSDDDYESKLSYIKNVLMGFLEHKEQRQQLLPVVSMLLKFSNQEEKKFLTSLK